MSLSDNVKRYIEEHIHLIDTNQYEALWLQAFDEFTYDDMICMAKFLYKADINIETDREKALVTLITWAIDDWALREEGVTQMPVRDFIEAFLDNRFGYPLPYVIDVMYKNKNIWINEVDIFVENGICVINREKSIVAKLYNSMEAN